MYDSITLKLLPDSNKDFYRSVILSVIDTGTRHKLLARVGGASTAVNHLVDNVFYDLTLITRIWIVQKSLGG